MKKMEIHYTSCCKVIPSLFFVVSVCIANISHLANAQQRLVAVTSLIGFEQFYLRIKRLESE
jgi:hypothetical protein